MASENKNYNVGLFSDIRTAIQAMINRTCIVSYGIIKNIPADGIVEVEISVADNEMDLEVITCVLANIASDNFTLNIKPKVDDKVLVVFPNKFDPDMFDKSKNEVIVSDSPSGYDLFSGIAILINQYKTNDHKNVITIDEGGTFTYENNKVTISLDENGAFTFTNEKSSTSVDANGYLHYANTDSNDNKSKIDFTSNGFLIQDKNGNKIEAKKEGNDKYVILNGHLKVK